MSAPYWNWASHLPLINTITAILDFNLVVELGVGQFSTTAFAEKNSELICIENDVNWLNIAKNLIRNREIDFRLHRIDSNISSSTKLHELSYKQKLEIENYYHLLYHEISDRKDELRLLFVDQYTALRTISINILFSKFNVIVYHDCEPEGIKWYSYDFNPDLIKDYDHYKLKTPISDTLINPIISWTGYFINKNLNINEQKLKEVSVPFINSYCDKFRVGFKYQLLREE